jgi:hypothetical protein
MSNHLRLPGRTRLLLTDEESQRLLELLETTQAAIEKTHRKTDVLHLLRWISGIAAILYTTSLLK